MAKVYIKRSWLASFAMAASACSPATLGSIPIEESTSQGTSSQGDGDTDDGTDIKFDVAPPETNLHKIDLLFVIDNSGTMAQEQLTLAKNFPAFVQDLQTLKNADAEPVDTDVNIMVTTTDFGHPLCAPFAKHDPEQGKPISSDCIERLDRFIPLDDDESPVFEACTDVCVDGLEPFDHFIHFDTQSGENNVPPVAPADINGDNVPDDEIAQTFACVAPQGVDGCGYEAPLETMFQAINPTAWWNSGAAGKRPFIRHDAVLAIVIITDEGDCSVLNYTAFTDDDTYWNERDGVGKVPSSAICWNAGIECDPPNSMGEYEDCASNGEGVLQPVDRYTDYLVDTLGLGQAKEVVMLSILGVPPVVREDGDVVGGGVDDLVYRDWIDGMFPDDGDILPEDWPDDDAAYKQWLFGIGPGCTEYDEMTEFSGQGIPPVRIKEVCQALDSDDKVRCCIESVCESDFGPALKCLTDLIQDAIDFK